MKLNTWYGNDHGDGNWYKYFYAEYHNQYIGVEVEIKNRHIKFWKADFWEERDINTNETIIDIDSLVKNYKFQFIHEVIRNIFYNANEFLV